MPHGLSPGGSLLGFIPGQGWHQIWELALAFGLASLIGLERELRQKSAGLRTHALVGVGAALFLLVSKYGFGDVLSQQKVVLDPSRVAAQIVTGIGFIGGGLIFVRRDVVRGLTTAATIWVTAAIGMACAGGLVLLALLVTAGHFIVMTAYPILERRIPQPSALEGFVRIVYRDAPGVLRAVLSEATERGFAVTGIHTRQDSEELLARHAVEVTLMIHGKASASQLGAILQENEHVLEVHAADDDGDDSR